MGSTLVVDLVCFFCRLVGLRVVGYVGFRCGPACQCPGSVLLHQRWWLVHIWPELVVYICMWRRR